jgi:hypothetical protein
MSDRAMLGADISPRFGEVDIVALYGEEAAAQFAERFRLPLESLRSLSVEYLERAHVRRIDDLIKFAAPAIERLITVRLRSDFYYLVSMMEVPR